MLSYQKHTYHWKIGTAYPTINIFTIVNIIYFTNIHEDNNIFLFISLNINLATSTHKNIEKLTNLTFNILKLTWQWEFIVLKWLLLKMYLHKPLNILLLYPFCWIVFLNKDISL